MLLLIDAGNTSVKWALIPGKALLPGDFSCWHASGVVAHQAVESLYENWSQVIDRMKIRYVFISNVAGESIRNRLLGLFEKERLSSARIDWFSAMHTLAGVRNNYGEPDKLGCDRFAAMIGARALFPDRPLLVATCGTATTLDMLSAKGIFEGGMILPGLRLMAASLANNTAQLPDIGLPPHELPFYAQDTSTAICRGCVSAQVGAIEHAFRLHQNNHKNVQCILSGGAASWIEPHLSIASTTVDNLVLLGLQTVLCHQGDFAC